MSDIVVSRNTIPLTNQERNTPASNTARNQTAQKFHDALSEARKQQNNKTTRTTQDHISPDRNYTIHQGDTLSEIIATESKKLGINHSRRDLYNMVNQIADSNDLSNPDSIFPGRELNLACLTQPASEPISCSGPAPINATRKAPFQPHPMETRLQSPVSGKITSVFGMRNHPILGKELHHDGIDISQPTGTPVKSMTSGVVTFSGENGGYGQMVEIDHGNGLTSRYAHLSKLSVRQGEHIDPEQTIGQVGQTGQTTGPHLHLEIRRHNTPIDPLTVLHRHQVENNLIFAEARTSHRF